MSAGAPGTDMPLVSSTPGTGRAAKRKAAAAITNNIASEGAAYSTSCFSWCKHQSGSSIKDALHA